MPAAYQDERITIIDEGITVGQTAFTMNLLDHAKVTRSSISIGFVSSLLNAVIVLFNIPLVLFDITIPTRKRPSIYHLVLNITGKSHTVLSSKDRDYIHMLAGLINTFKGHTPHPEPEFDYEGEVLE